MGTRLFVAALLALALSGMAHAAEIRLSWQVVQPFRLFRFQSDQQIHEWAYRAVMDDPSLSESARRNNIVSEMEKRLNDPAWWEQTPSWETQSYRQMFEAARKSEEEQSGRPFLKFDPRLGWASMLRDGAQSGPATGTCWNNGSKNYRGCTSDIGLIGGGNEYIFPKQHLVEASVETKTAEGWKPYRASCTYIVGENAPKAYALLPEAFYRGAEAQKITRTDCDAPVYIRVKAGETYRLKVTAADGSVTPAENIAVKDLLVVGIGDSFASGEGNPEVPALLDRRNGISPYIKLSATDNNIPDNGQIIPTRELSSNGKIASGTAARWLDPQCHRSIYSAQARTAIALALSGERHHAVTFVSYACSGAEITDGLFWPQDHRECTDVGTAGNTLHRPQISAVVAALTQSGTSYQPFSPTIPTSDTYRKLTIDVVSRKGYSQIRSTNNACKSWPGVDKVRNNPLLLSGKIGRPIDLLLVSIGGNDMGFGPLVTKAVVNSGFLRKNFPIFTDIAILIYQKAARGITIADAKRNLGMFKDRFAMLQQAITQKFEMKDPVSGAPQSGRVILSAYPRIGSDSKGFCPPGNAGMNISTLFSVLPDLSPDDRPNDVTPRRADEISVTLNTRLATIAKDYGWVFADGQKNGQLTQFKNHGFCASSSVANANKLDVPHRMLPSNTSWTPYDPTTGFYPYVSRGRWVRTFNDAYLLSFYFKQRAVDERAVRQNPGIYQAARALGGPMHPTAEGHAHMADAIYEKALPILFTNGLPK
jgi:hypothetical protein